MGPVLLGAVAYDPKVVTIWDGFRAWLREHDLELDYVLYSNYERQVEDLVAGRIDAAWNSPLAWIRTERLARAAGRAASALTMRDTDRDLRSVIVTRVDSGITSVADLHGRIVGTGAVDSPQATLIPLSLLRSHGLVPGADFTVRRFDVGVGLHGDHIGGERDAARALVAGEVDAACMIDANFSAFANEATLPSGATNVIASTALYDHCNMTVLVDSGRSAAIDELGALLRSMSYDDPRMRPLLDLEGLRVWEPGRTTGYELLQRAVGETAFYTEDGDVVADDYRP